MGQRVHQLGHARHDRQQSRHPGQGETLRDEIRAALLARLESVLFTLFPAGKVRRGMFHIGDILGSPGDSLEIVLTGEKAGLWTDALPHFLHPVEELYDKLAPHIKLLKLKPFKQQLNALAQTVKAKNAPAYDEALKALEGRLASVDTGMKAETKNWMPFVVQTALETMRSAIGEYEESIEDGKFAKAVEYQDSRGFVFQGESLLQSVGPDLAAKYPQDSAAALAAIATLKSGWPAPLPPAAPVLDVASVKAAVSKIELALGSVK